VEIAVPSQEIFFSERLDGKHVEVIKTYDPQFAREAFDQMNDEARAVLIRSLISCGTLDQSDMSDLDDDGLWQEIEDGSREDWNTFSYFVVAERRDADSRTVFVCSDWPTAEAFAKLQLGGIHRVP
jgi:hypothetical protein